MKKFCLVFISMACLISLAQAQKATLNITLKNSTATNCRLWIPAKGLVYDYLQRGSFNIPLTGKKGSVSINVNHPVFAYLSFYDSESDGAKRYKYKLYLSAKYTLKVNADAANGNVEVSGPGSHDNQPLLGRLSAPDPQKLYGDTLPNRIIALANDYQKQLQTAFHAYIKTYNPSPAFKKNETEEINYSALEVYYDFKENNKYQIGRKYNRNMAAWQKIQDSLMRTTKVNNNDALAAISYQEFLRDYLMREKERLWLEAHDHPVEFYKDYYQTDTIQGKKLYADDVENLFSEKIVNKNFTGAVEEQGYALAIDNALGEHNPQNLVAIFGRLSQKHPHSEYIQLYKPVIDSIRQLEQRPLTSDMILLPQNGTELKSLNDVLALAKGKTVLLDMWGTWCAPCRNEIHDNSAAIKAHFKGKGLDYFYVANRELNHVDLWKKLIAYFDMRGTHILANTTLTKNIMATVKGEGYPTYVIIKKDGTWELSKAGYPMKREVLIQQLEAALAK